ncbi:MAG: hypothetical protein KDD55_11670, partial [Bdellovibrionales bacterium]|nr:hypothetical protein [Bdellovibrionales bacterium]
PRVEGEPLSSFSANRGLSYPTENPAADVRSVFERIDEGSRYALDQFAQLGKRWKEIKSGTREASSLLGDAAGMTNTIRTGYESGVAQRIADAGDLTLKEATARVPRALRGGLFSKGLGFAGSIVGSATGILNVAESFYEEGRVGKKTAKSITTSVMQNIVGSAVGTGLGAGVAAVGLGIAGAPLVLGIGAGVVAGMATGKVMDWVFG